MHRHDLDHLPTGHDPVARALSLLTGLLVAALLIFQPRVALDRWGVADPTAAALLVWAMLVGLASGTGWRPGRTLPRRLLCSESCLVALTLSLLRIAGH